MVRRKGCTCRHLHSSARPGGASHPDGRRSSQDRIPPGEDPAKMITEISPGKRGGEFEFVFGGTVRIEPGTFHKSDVITCCQVSPSNRHKHLPPLEEDEKLLSEIFMFTTSTGNRTIKKPIKLTFPYRNHNEQLFETKLLVKPTSTDEWVTADYVLLESPRMFTLDVGGAGVYVLISTPKSEPFTVPSSGCLYTSNLNHHITIRIPKKATDVDIPCSLTIMPLQKQNLDGLYKDFPNDMKDLVVASDFYDFRPSMQREYKRGITIKLPLPVFDGESFADEDICIMSRQSGATWELMDVPIKMIKTQISFETKTLCRFCIAVAKPQRKKRLKEAFKRIEAEQNLTRGAILPFIHIKEKAWAIWVDCVQLNSMDSCTSDRLQQGFRPLKLVQDLPDTVTENNILGNKRNWRSKPKVLEQPKSEKEHLELSDRTVYEIELPDEIREVKDGYRRLHYCSLLRDSYKKLNVEPVQQEEPKSINSVIKCYLLNTQTNERNLVRTYELDITKQEVEQYFYVEPEPEPEPEPEVESIVIEEPVVLTPAPVIPKPKRSNPATFARLTQLNKIPRKIFKESRTLTGRSLKTLANEIEQGLTLAIHLDLTDSAITGMGFDALANGSTLADITYRILLLWKRRTNRYKEQQVEMLCEALKEMELENIAMIVMHRHQENQELLPGCFQQETNGIAKTHN